MGELRAEKPDLTGGREVGSCPEEVWLCGPHVDTSLLSWFRVAQAPAFKQLPWLSLRDTRVQDACSLWAGRLSRPRAKVPLAWDNCHPGRPCGLTGNYLPGPSKQIGFFAVLRRNPMARKYCWRQMSILRSILGGFVTLVNPPCVPPSLPSTTSCLSA